MMTDAELRDLLGRLELTQSGAARMLGVDPRTMRRWIAGERAIPEVVVRLLDLLEHVPAARKRLENTLDE